jgi:hypothetical protein
MKRRTVLNQRVLVLGLLVVACIAILLRGIWLEEPAVNTVDFYFIFVAYIVLFPLAIAGQRPQSSRRIYPFNRRPPPSQ